jgi:hypothetical protein
VRKTAVLFPAFFLFIFFGCSEKASETEEAPDVPVPAVFSLDTGNVRVLSGDIAGDKREEIVLVDGSRITVFSPSGEKLREKEFDVPGFFSGFFADINNDGKEECILGTDRDKSARVVVVDGFLNIIFEHTDFPGRTQRTKPLRYSEGTLFYTTYSTQNMLPKAVAAVNTKTGTVRWRFHSGPVPFDASFSSLPEKLAISNRAFSGEEYEAEIPYTVPRDRHAVIVLNAETGEPEVYENIGPEAKEGFVVDGAVSGVRAEVIDTNGDGEEELYLCLDRMSDFYPGNAVLQARNLEGKKVLYSRPGPEQTEGELYPFSFGGREVLLVVWKQAGIVEIVDHTLETLARYVLPGDFHNIKVVQTGPFLEDGKTGILLRNDNRLYLLSNGLRPVWCNAFGGVVTGAVIIEDGAGGQTLGVAAGAGFYLFPDGWRQRSTMEVFTVPAGATVSVDGGKIPKAGIPFVVPAGNHTVRAELDGLRSSPAKMVCGPGTHTTVELPLEGYVPNSSHKKHSLFSSVGKNMVIVPPLVPEAPANSYADFAMIRAREFSPAVYVHAAGDFTGTDKKELLLRQPAANRSIMLDGDLEPVRYIPFPPEQSVYWLPAGDFDGDGKDDVVTSAVRSPGPLFISYRNADGRLLFRKELHYGTDTVLTAPYRDSEDIAVLTITGYQIQPRSFLTLSPRTGDLRLLFHRAITFRATEVCKYNGAYYLSSYTPSNGGTYVRPDGTVETDSELHIHILSAGGELLPGSGKLEHENNSGNLSPIIYDADGDGRKEVYYLEGKNAGYYSGTPVLYRIDEETGKRTSVYTGGPDDQSLSVRLALIDGKQHLAIVWRERGAIDFLDENYMRVLETKLPKGVNGSLLRFIDADADGTSEFFGWDAESAYIFSVDGKIIRTFASGLPDTEGEETILHADISDLDGDGRPEIILNTGSGITLYSY